MQDIQEQLQSVEWVDSPQGQAPIAPPPSKMPKPHVIRGVLLAVAVALLIIIIIAIAQFFRVRKQNVNYLNGVEYAVDQAQAECRGVQDEEKCIAMVPYRLAQETGDPVHCQDLSGMEQDECLGLAALSSQDTRICKQIEDESLRNLCQDALISQSMQAGDVAACEELSQQELVENCMQTQLFALALNGDCSHEMIDEDMCAAGRAIAQGLEEKNSAYCADLAGEWKDICYEYIGPSDMDGDGVDAQEEQYQGTSDVDADSDGDGLSDGEELYTIGSDPTNADTDGDGYEDGVEVQNGFDPLQ